MSIRLKADVIQSIMTLRETYAQLPWYKKLFFPNQLAKELSKSTSDITYKDIETLFYCYESAWLSRKIFSCLQIFESSSGVKAYRSHIKQEYPIYYWLWLWGPLSNTGRNQFCLDVSEKVEKQCTVVASKNAFIKSVEAIQTTSDIKLESIFMRKLGECNEKSIELRKKCLQLSNYLAHEIARLTTSLVSYIEIEEKCKQLTTALSKLKHSEKNAMKYSHEKLHNEEEKQYASVCALGHPAARGCICLLGHPVPFIARIVQKREAVYIPDDNARQIAHDDALRVEVELQVESSKLSPIPDDYLHLKAISALPKKLKNLAETLRIYGAKEESFDSSHQGYKDILGVCKIHCLNFQEEDYLITSNLQKKSLFHNNPSDEYSSNFVTSFERSREKSTVSSHCGIESVPLVMT